jgi:hypothetical protein
VISSIDGVSASSKADPCAYVDAVTTNGSGLRITCPSAQRPAEQQISWLAHAFGNPLKIIPTAGQIHDLAGADAPY